MLFYQSKILQNVNGETRCREKKSFLASDKNQQLIGLIGTYSYFFYQNCHITAISMRPIFAIYSLSLDRWTDS